MARLGELRREAAGCTACPLYRDATQTVFGEGSSRAKLMLVGEQPGDWEDRAGAPFVGPAGRLLDEALEQAGIERRLAAPRAGCSCGGGRGDGARSSCTGRRAGHSAREVHDRARALTELPPTPSPATAVASVPLQRCQDASRTTPSPSPRPVRSSSARSSSSWTPTSHGGRGSCSRNVPTGRRRRRIARKSRARADDRFDSCRPGSSRPRSCCWLRPAPWLSGPYDPRHIGLASP
ncbi:MAG: hypothetical protein C5B48_06525 [Candidatus Rokuibacteriota bacterium]|nr:MAG: hypothetical protein C5B48_06525 [Candidatus Rokubacteria bacterium]